MSLYIPCLNVDHPDDGGGLSVGVSASPVGGESPSIVPSISIGDPDIPFTLNILPVFPYILPGINFQFWANLFGLGETRIDREKEQIQDVLTPIFKYLNRAYGVPITDGHALQFPSKGVKAQFALRPDIAALVDEFASTAPTIAHDVFATPSSTAGEEQRVTNQFLANAAYNHWTVDATRTIWNGMVEAASPTCSQDQSRWIRNPEIIRDTAQLAIVLQYVPLSVMLDMAHIYALGDPLYQRLVELWANDPELVASIPHVEKYDWQQMYADGTWCLPPYQHPFGGCVPLMERDHIQALFQNLTLPVPRYPDFDVAVPAQPVPQPQPAPPPVQQQPVPTVDAQPLPPPNIQPPYPSPGQQVLEIPSQAELDRACQIVKKLNHGGSVTLDESNFMLTITGMKAINAAFDNPQCYDPNIGQQPSPVPTQNTNCPPPQQYPPPGWQGQLPQPVPQPIPGLDDQPQPHPCDPACQEQIDRLDEKIHECCNEVAVNVFPRLDDIEHWLYDLEGRVPGPQPELPYPYPVPPVGNVPGTDIPPVPPDDVPTTPALPPIDCESTWITSLLECIIPKLPQKETLKKLVFDACQLGVKAWGIMAECWLDYWSPDPPQEFVLPAILTSPTACSVEIYNEIATDADTFYTPMRIQMSQWFRIALAGQADETQWPYEKPTPQHLSIFRTGSEETTVDVPIEETP